jgi:hypothetical protein
MGWLMATYQEIIEDIQKRHGVTVKKCWIAHVKELNGIKTKKTWNRTNKRKHPCPAGKRIIIEQSLKNFGII